MRDHLRRSLVRTFVLACALLSLGAHADEVLGTKPAHIPGAPSSVPNEQAMTKRIWAPGIDDGYVPQGVTWADGAFYRIDAASGDVLATHDMVVGVEDLAFDDAGRLWSVSEAGSLRWRTWSATYPMLFRLDPGQLR